MQSLLAGNDYWRPAGNHEIKSQLMQLREEVGIIRSAIVEQQQKVNDARGSASREICTQMKPQHDASLRAQVIGALGVQQAALITVQLRNHLDNANVSLNSLPSLSFGEFGLAALEPCSQRCYLVREALALALIERSEVPAGWLVRWGM